MSTDPKTAEPKSPSRFKRLWVPTRRLESKDVAGVAKYIAAGHAKKVFFMIGAGVSTSAGIPDFRSPETGLYANLSRLNLPYPEAVFEINFFKQNPIPFYTLARELYPGKFRPTLSHAFIRLLAAHDFLHTCFTQNIDTLERRAGVPANKIIEAHGSFASQRCVECQMEFDEDGLVMKDMVMREALPTCEQPYCGGLVKPDIVFFGEALPDEFIQALPLLGEADLLIIMGTSLTVHPFASLAGMVPDSCPRVLINIERVGDIGSRKDDVVLLGKCDEIVEQLCEALGWGEELQQLWAATEDSVEVDEAKAKEVEDEVAELAEHIREKMALKEKVEDGVADTKFDATPVAVKLELPDDSEKTNIVVKEEVDADGNDAEKDDEKKESTETAETIAKDDLINGSTTTEGKL